MAGKKPEQRRRLQHAGAQGIGDAHVAGARRRDQAGDAERRIGAQSGRIAVFIVQTAQKRMHALQTLQGFQIDAIVAHRQVRSFDQRKTQIAREKNMLEIGFVVRPWRQQRDQRRFAIGGRERGKLLLQRAEKIGQSLHAERAKNVFVQRRDDERFCTA